MAQTRRRDPLFQPGAYRAMGSGANQLINAIRPTLGPVPRVTAVERLLDNRGPELLDNGGVIAKRIIQLPHIHADFGAMFVRDFLWRLQDQEGDGTATAAVLFQAVFTEGVRLVTAGHNARRLQTYLNEGTGLVLEELGRMTVPVEGKEQLGRLAYTICRDEELSQLLGEIFDIIGPYGRLEIRKGNTRDLKREYVEGMYWDRGVLSREFIKDYSRMRTDLENAAIFISDLAIKDAQALAPVLEQAIQNKLTNLLIVADEIAPGALALLHANNRPDRLCIVAVKTPGYSKEEQADFLTDLPMLSAGRALVRAAGDTPAGFQARDFGRARRVWAETQNFGIIGGRGDARTLRRHVMALRSAYEETVDIVLRSKLQQRLGRLLSGSATLWIGGVNEREIEAHQETAERTAAALRGALRDGAVAGGGVALWACRQALLACAATAADPDARAAYQILAKAVAEPLRTIAVNAGCDPSDIVAELRLAGPGYGYDALTGRITYMAAAGILDPANVQKAAAYAGLTSAALALTIDVLVHRPEQPTRATGRGPGRRKRL